MSGTKPRRPCRYADCTALTKARNQLCPLHRPDVVVTAHSGAIQITTTDAIISYTAALQLADDLVDAVERADSPAERNPQ